MRVSHAHIGRPVNQGALYFHAVVGVVRLSVGWSLGWAMGGSLSVGSPELVGVDSAGLARVLGGVVGLLPCGEPWAEVLLSSCLWSPEGLPG